MGSLFHKHIAVLLIFLIATQELCSAKHQLSRLDQYELSKESKSLVEKKSLRGKRSISAILFGTALFISMANIAFDIYLQIKGCCGLYPSACDYQRKFNDTRASIEATSSKIDIKWNAAENLRTYIQSCSIRNEEIALEMKRITQRYESIMETVDPEIINKYNNVTSELKKEIEKKNSTVLAWKEADIDTAFTSLFDTSLGRLQILSGIIGQVAEGGLAYVWNWYKTAKIQKMLSTNYGSQLTIPKNKKATKLLGSIDADDFIRETAKSRRNADISTSRGAKAMNTAAGVLHLVQIGVDIWMVVLKVKQCQTIRDTVREAYFKIQPEDKKIKDLYSEINGHYTNMSGTYQYMKTQISKKEFLGYLGQIKNLSNSASTQTTSMKSASADIQLFIDQIATAKSNNEVYKLQGKLIKAMEKITFTLDCYYKKVKTFEVAHTRCKAGHDTMSDIYNKLIQEFSTNSNDCSYNASMTYTKYGDVLTYVTIQARAEKFNSDCPLNNKIKGNLICSKKCDGKSEATISTEIGITTAYVKKFFKLCPSKCPLTPAQVKQICTIKGFGMLLENILMVYTNLDALLVEKAFKNC